MLAESIWSIISNRNDLRVNSNAYCKKLAFTNKLETSILATVISLEITTGGENITVGQNIAPGLPQR